MENNIPLLSSLTPDDKTKLLAELDGYNHWFNGWNKLQDNTPPLLLTEQLPQYLTSYDAIIPLVQKLDKDTKARLVAQFIEPTRDIIDDMIALLELTPSQLSDAVLIATGKARLG